MNKLATILFLVVSSLSPYVHYCQSLSAEGYLDLVYEKVSSSPAVAIEFNYKLNNTEANISQSTPGTIYLSGVKYRLELFGTQQLFDGVYTYTIIPDNEEVIISTVKESGEEELDPSTLFSFYKEGYRIEFKSPPSTDKAFISLFPIDSTSEITEIEVTINPQLGELRKLSQVGENGTTTSLEITSTRFEKTINAEQLLFDRSYYESLGYYFIEE